jgi:hypothetical protein
VHRSKSRHLVAFLAASVIAVAVPISIASIGVTSATASGSTTCSKLSGSITGTLTFKKCVFASGKDKTNKSLSGNATLLLNGGTLTWASSGQTTVVAAPSVSNPGQGSCKPKNQEYIATGSVTGGSSTHTQAGDTFSASVCVKGSKIALLKGTVAHL